MRRYCRWTELDVRWPVRCTRGGGREPGGPAVILRMLLRLQVTVCTERGASETRKSETEDFCLVREVICPSQSRRTRAVISSTDALTRFEQDRSRSRVLVVQGASFELIREALVTKRVGFAV